jgi:hypothetical protein
MALHIENEPENLALFFAKGTVLHVRIKDETTPLPFEDFVQIELLSDLKLNFEKKLGVLEDCQCYIPRLETKSRSVNHAYTIISDHFEKLRMAKGGNVFRKVYYVDPTGHWVPIGKKRDLLRSDWENRKKEQATNVESKVEPIPVAPFDPSSISLLLNDLLYEGALFAKLAGSTVEKCRAALKKSGSSRDEDLGRFFPFYHHVFGVFKHSLGSMAIKDLMGRWSENVQPFVRGAWTGFYQNEVDWLINNDDDFAHVIVELMNSRDTEEDQAKLYEWIKHRKEEQAAAQNTHSHESGSDENELPKQIEREDIPEVQQVKSVLSPSEENLRKIADIALGRERDEWHLDPPEACDYCFRRLAECLYFVDGKEKGSSVWGNMCPDCFLIKGEGVRWGSGQLYHRVPENGWLMVGGFRTDDEEPDLSDVLRQIYS